VDLTPAASRDLINVNRDLHRKNKKRKENHDDDQRFSTSIYWFNNQQNIILVADYAQGKNIDRISCLYIHQVAYTSSCIVIKEVPPHASKLMLLIEHHFQR